jgi:hypothetical protein
MGVEHATRSQAALGASRSGSLPGGAVCRCDQRLLRSQAVRVCASQYGPRFTTGLPHKLYGRVSPSGHWQPRGTGGGRGAAAGGDGFLARLYRITRHRRVRLPRVPITGGEF